jgi:uncharacterized protein YaaW (UPF0174 family)
MLFYSEVDVAGTCYRIGIPGVICVATGTGV